MRNTHLHYYWFVTVHKLFVLYYMFLICCRLMKRAVLHDMSKYRSDEKGGFFKLIEAFKNTRYGSKEYYDILAKEKATIDLHYSRNDHHPEWHKSLSHMNLYQLLELYCDWQASAKKNKGGNINKSFEINKERFKMSDELVRLLKSLYEQDAKR